MEDSGPAVTEREALARLWSACRPSASGPSRGPGRTIFSGGWTTRPPAARIVAACRRLGLLADGPPGDPGDVSRAGVPDSGGARLPGLDRTVLTGQYGCPVGRCARRGRRGRPRRAAVLRATGAPMVFRADA